MNLVSNLRKAIRKKKIVIETKEGGRVEGRVDRVDKEMNTRLKNCTVHRGGKTSHASLLTIRGSTIRYVVFDDRFDMTVFGRDVRPRIRQRRKKSHLEPFEEIEN